MRTTIVLVLSFIFVGCESDFDKCLNTELPRAEEILELEGGREVGRQLTSLSDLTQKYDAFDAGINVWVEKNPEPSGRPTFFIYYPQQKCSEQFDLDSGFDFMECYDQHEKRVEEWTKIRDQNDQKSEEWNALPEVIAWTELREAADLRLARANGLQIENADELFSLHEQIWKQMESLVKPRSSIWQQCFDGGDCYDVGFGIAIAEATLNNANMISELKETSKELATLTCNNNGFYE